MPSDRRWHPCHNALPESCTSPQFPIYPATNEIFHDPALLAAEQAHLFENGWILVGLDDQLPDNERSPS